MKREIISQLTRIVGKNQITTSPEELLCYSYDGTAKEFLPEAVVFPTNPSEISKIMELANSALFPVVPRGAGSGMTGGALPVTGGIVLAMSRLNRILEIDEINQIAVVEPGVITGDLRTALARKGLYYPPDPASLKFCTMGGNVAECAGGPSAVKYGVTRDYVLGLEVVLPDGRIIKTGVRTAKGVVGYDLTRLFIGSEGTLGVITKITVKIIPLPRAKKTFLVLCRSISEATVLVAEILAQHRPCTLEFMDRTAIGIVRDKLPFTVNDKIQALLLIEVDGDIPSVTIQGEALQQFFAGKNDQLTVMQAANKDEIDALWTARRSVSPAAFALKPHKIGEDVVVPRSKIPELVLFVEKLAAELNLIIFTFGHAGDGNIHVNIMLDKNDETETYNAEIATRALFEQVVKLGGTLSGEHGIGITKAPYVSLELDQASIDVMHGIKTFFDPNNILNPGKMFPPR